MRKLFLNVTYAAKSGKREDFIEAVNSSGILGKIREEDGCIGYEYFYAADDPGKILLVERWESEAKQSAHLKRPHMELLKAIKEKYVAGTEIVKGFSAD